MTKCIVLGENDDKRKGMPIEFVRLIYPNEFSSEFGYPKRWDNIELIAKDYSSGYDLMFAYDDDDLRGNGACFFGHWNDGFVED